MTQLLKTDRSKGVLMSLLGVFILSPDGLIIRLLGLDNSTIIFYRGLFSAISITVLLLFYYRRQFFSVVFGIGIIGVINGFILAITNITFVSSVQMTSVANTLLILSSAPVFAAILSLIILKENQRPMTWVVIVVAFVAIFIIGYGNYGSGSFSGDLLALCCAVSTGFSAVLVRLKKDIDLVPSIIIGGVLVTLYATLNGPIAVIDSIQLFYLMILGFGVIPLAFLILTTAPRFTSAAEVQIIFLLEAVLGPLWVWIVINETPSMNTLIGGSLLISSVFFLAVTSVTGSKKTSG